MQQRIFKFTDVQLLCFFSGQKIRKLDIPHVRLSTISHRKVINSQKQSVFYGQPCITYGRCIVVGSEKADVSIPYPTVVCIMWVFSG